MNGEVCVKPSLCELVQKDRRYSGNCEEVEEGVEVIEGTSEKEKRMAKLGMFCVITTSQKMMNGL